MEIATSSRRPRRVLSRLVGLVSAVLTLLALAFMAPAAFGLQRYVITGTSMNGSIDAGSVAFEEVVPVSELEVGDVITYLPPPGSGLDEMVTHRIISIKGNTFRTKGDAVPQADPWKFQLDGPTQARVEFAVPYVGYVFIALADRDVRVVVISIPAGLITLLSFVQLLKAMRRRPADAVGRAPGGDLGTGPDPGSGRSSVPVGG